MNELMNYQQLAMDWLNTANANLNENQKKQFIMFCQLYQLNPWKNEAYAVNFKDKFGNVKMQLVTSYLVVLARAMSNPKYYRYEMTYWQDNRELHHPHLTPEIRGVVVGVNIYDKEGKILSNTSFDIDENASANTGSFKASHYNSWVEKCALTNAFRRTFTNDVAGLYIAEEFDTDQVTTATPSSTRRAPRISDTYKDCEQALAQIEPSEQKQNAIIKAFIKAKGIKQKDMLEGNFDSIDFLEYAKNYKGE